MQIIWIVCTITMLQHLARKIICMKTLSSREVQKNFGTVADLVTSGESVRVTKYGRPAFFIIPENSDTEEILRLVAGMRLSALIQTSQPSDAVTPLSQAQVNTFIGQTLPALTEQTDAQVDAQMYSLGLRAEAYDAAHPEEQTDFDATLMDGLDAQESFDEEKLLALCEK